MKKNYMKKLTALVLGGLMTTTMASAAMAESVDMTLEESVRTALDNNYSIKQQEAEYDSAVWARHQARRSFGPTVNWKSTATKMGGKYNDKLSLSRNYGNTLSLTMPIYTGGQLEGAIKAADLAMNANELGLELSKQKVKAATMSAYYQALQAKNQIKVAQDSVNTLIEVYKADPSNFSSIIGSSADKNLEDARALTIMLGSGRPIEDIIRGKAEIQKLKDEGNTKEITKIRNKAIKAIQDPMLGDSKDIDYNGKTFVTTLTFAFRSMGETAENAVALAEAEYNKSFKNLMGTSVPSSFFTGWSGLTVPDKELIARIKKEIPSKYLEDVDKNVTLSFDSSSNVLTVADRSGNSIFSLNQAEASNLVDNIIDEIYNKVERQEMLQEQFTSLTFGSDLQYNDK